MGKIEINSTLSDIFNIIKECDINNGSMLSEKSDDSYDNLKSSFESAIEPLQIKNVWDDQISMEINGSVKSGINNLIESCKTPANQIILSAGINANTLKNSIKTYIEKVEAYNAKDDELIALGSCPPETILDSQKNRVRNPRYYSWQSNYSAITGIMNTLSNEIQTWENSSNESMNIIKELLSPIGSKSSTIALGKSSTTTTVYEGTSVEEFGYDATHKIEGTVVRDENGNIISETYYILDADGNIVQTGVINYNADGTKNVEEFIKTYEMPTDVTNPSVELLGDTTGLGKYVADETIPTTTEKSTEYEYDTDKETGQETFKSTEEYSNQYSDETTRTGTLKAEGVVVDGETVPQHSVDEFILNKSGSEYNGVTDTVYGTGGHVEAETVIINQDGEQVLQISDETVAEYRDSTIGANVEVTKTSVDDGTTTTMTSEVISTAGNQVYQQTDSLVTQNVDPQVGTVIEDNNVTEVYRDETGQLWQKEGIINSDGVSEFIGNPMAIDDEKAILTMTAADGSSSSIVVNPNSSLDLYRMRVEINNANVESGWKEGTALAGRDLMMLMDGENLEVCSVDGTVQYTFEYTSPENVTEEMLSAIENQ